MDFVQAQIELYTDEIDLDRVKTETGDVYAVALVDDRGSLVRVVDADTGETVKLGPDELARVKSEAYARWEGSLK